MLFGLAVVVAFTAFGFGMGAWGMWFALRVNGLIKTD